MQKGRLILILIGLVILAVIGFFIANKIGESNSQDNNRCISDSDCVPAQVCHPTSCVNKEFEPNKTGISCTQVCEPGTLNCGQGSCLCKNNKCEAVLRG